VDGVVPIDHVQTRRLHLRESGVMEEEKELSNAEAGNNQAFTVCILSLSLMLLFWWWWLIYKIKIVVAGNKRNSREQPRRCRQCQGL
jgi:hypothetical protein